MERKERNVVMSDSFYKKVPFIVVPHQGVGTNSKYFPSQARRIDKIPTASTSSTTSNCNVLRPNNTSDRRAS